MSFLEALSYGTLLVSNRNPDELTSKFGIWTGQINGDGFEQVDLYVDAIRELVCNEEKRRNLSIDGRKYVEEVHSICKFKKDLINVIKGEI